jgi:hypothetical protein
MALLFLKPGREMEVGDEYSIADDLTTGKETIVEEGMWTSGPVSMGTEDLSCKGIRSPDHPAFSEPQYRLRIFNNFF